MEDGIEAALGQGQQIVQRLLQVAVASQRVELFQQLDGAVVVSRQVFLLLGLCQTGADVEERGQFLAVPAVAEGHQYLLDQCKPEFEELIGGIGIQGTVTGELLPNPVTPGSLYPLTMQNVSAVQIQDSDVTPKTLPVSHYSVNAKHGSLVVLDATSGGPYTEPFTVDYAYGAAQSTAMFTQPLPERWIRFEGLNTADGNREVVIDLYRVAINPAKELSIITDELLKIEQIGRASCRERVSSPV